jgi:hypothetical protein
MLGNREVCAQPPLGRLLRLHDRILRRLRRRGGGSRRHLRDLDLRIPCLEQPDRRPPQGDRRERQDDGEEGGERLAERLEPGQGPQQRPANGAGFGPDRRCRGRRLLRRRQRLMTKVSGGVVAGEHKHDQQHDDRDHPEPHPVDHSQGLPAPFEVARLARGPL